MSFFGDWLALTPDFLGGLWVSGKLCLVALAIGFPLGIALALWSSVPNRFARGVAIVIVEIGRGAPSLIILYLVYYGLPQFHLTLTGFVSAAIGLGYIYGAFTAEVFRAGIKSIPTGHLEASRALGLPRVAEIRLIILPQAIRAVTPPLIGFAILLFQATSLAFAISVPELLSVAYNHASITYRFWPALTLAGLMYVVVTLVSTWLVELTKRKKRISGQTVDNCPHDSRTTLI